MHLNLAASTLRPPRPTGQRPPMKKWKGSWYFTRGSSKAFLHLSWRSATSGCQVIRCRASQHTKAAYSKLDLSPLLPTAVLVLAGLPLCICRQWHAATMSHRPIRQPGQAACQAATGTTAAFLPLRHAIHLMCTYPGVDISVACHSGKPCRGGC